MKTHRGIVYSRNGGAAASQPLAVSAALEIEKAGAASGGTGLVCAVETGEILTIF